MPSTTEPRVITMSYFHTVTIFAGSQDPVKVTSYTEAEQKAYEASLPTDAKILYSGSSGGEMRRVFNAHRSAPDVTATHISDRKEQTHYLRAVQVRYQMKGKWTIQPDEIHTRRDIQLIIDKAWWD